jgi:hypothetical protein
MFGLGEGGASGETEQIGWGKEGEAAGSGDVSPAMFCSLRRKGDTS